MVKRSDQAVEAWRKKHEMVITGNSCPQPVETFAECNFPQQFLQKFTQLGFTAPTPIQSQGWPMALTGRDVVGIAETGSGKTLAFVLPGVIHSMAQPPLRRGDGPICLVVAPTRELACQIEVETKKFATCTNIRVACVYGGAPKRNQEYHLRSGVEILICTPGRMLDFLERRTTNLRRCTYLVFDEADRMLDMGFEGQIRALVSQIRPDRQVLMWSATWPKEVRKLADDFLPNDKLILKIGGDDKANKNVTQVVEVIARYQKMNRLQSILAEKRGKTIIFTATKRMADQLARDLNRYGHWSGAIHGDKKQDERSRTLSRFKEGQLEILVATDVASRGIHVPGVVLIVNYDFAQNCEDYIHRIGRTGRAGATGTAITFFDPQNDSKHARGLVDILAKSGQQIPPQLQALSHQRSRGGYGNSYSRRSGRGYRPY